MRKVLYFIGHYDYWIYSILLGSQWTDKETKADFIILATGNDTYTKAFIRDKAESEHFAVVEDESFLDQLSEEATIDAIRKGYTEIFEKFQTKISDYTDIYVSFDEWNSFGIYLAQQSVLPKVSLVVKHENQLQADIYHYLDSPGKYFFSSLQRKCRVLEAPDYVEEIIVLRKDFPGHRDEKGRVWSGFDALEKLDNLEEEQYQSLCELFQFQPEQYTKQKYSLLITDSNWFGEESQSYLYDYLYAYQKVIGTMTENPGEKWIVKMHPRFQIPEFYGKIAFPECESIPSHVPVELIGYREKIRIHKTVSVGNQIPGVILKKSDQGIVLQNSFFGFHRMLDRFQYCVQLVHNLKRVKTVYTRGVKAEDLDNFHVLSGGKATEFRTLEKRTKKSFVILQNVCGESFKEEIDNLLTRNNIVVILNPEYKFDLLEADEYADLKEKMIVYRMKKNILQEGVCFDKTEEMLWIFCPDPKIRNHIYQFKFEMEDPCSHLRTEIIHTPNLKNMILRNHSPVPEEKSYIRFRTVTSPIIILGASEMTYDFLLKYGARLRVRYIMADDDETIDERLRQNYEVIPTDFSRIRPTDYVIICKAFSHNLDKIPDYALARDNMLRAGFRVCQDFIYYKIFDAIMEEKQIMLFCGYCELSGIKQVLEMTSATEQFCMLFYHIGRETMEAAPGYADFIASAKLCDILVHAPLAIQRGVLDQDITELIGEDTETIFIPQINFRGYAPYKGVKYTKRNVATYLLGSLHYPFLYEIPQINQMIRKGCSNEKILETMLDPDLYTKEEVKKNLEFALEITRVMDEASDIPIYDFIQDHYKEELLFKDCMHVNDVMFFEYARRLAEYLELDCEDEIDEAQRICRENHVFFQVATEEPILPCVKEVLGLEFGSENMLYMQKVTEEKIRWKNRKEWLLDYCEYYRATTYLRRTFSTRYKCSQVNIIREEEKKYSIDRFKGDDELWTN